MYLKSKELGRHSRNSSKKKVQQGGKVNTNTLMMGLIIIILLVSGRDIFKVLAAKFGLMQLPVKVREIVIYRDRFIKAAPVTITKRDIREIAETVARSGGDPVSIISKHVIPVPKPAPGRDVEQYGYIVKPLDKEAKNEDGTYNLDLLIKYNAKITFGFRFNPMLTVGYDGFNISPGIGTTVFQFYRLQASAHVSTKYIAVSASWLVYKSTGVGVGYGFKYGKTAPGFILFSKVDF